MPPGMALPYGKGRNKIFTLVPPEKTSNKWIIVTGDNNAT